MTLDAGSRLGPYEVLAPLGAGGMGEVYRGRDAKLGRDVAVKVLPERYAGDAEALARFEREARAVAALSHPNILAIHDFGSDGGIHYAVTELLEGENLRSRLGGAPVGVRRAVEWAIQVGRGLAAAHEKGIVHRDLKPENIFVTEDGRVKILDFGLAKLLPLEAAGADTRAPTVEAGTEPGVVLGTIGYMSPEQVRGKPADQRSDIFSFGAILYEMLSGRRAFRGDSAADTMSAILKEDPPELSATTRGMPPALDRLVRHCLEKNPPQRFQSASDLVYELEALTGDSFGSSPGRTARSFSRWSAPRMSVLPAVGLAALGVLLGHFLWRHASVEPPSFRQLTFRHGNIGAARFSPDGQSIIYGASWEGQPIEIYQTRVGNPESLPLGFRKANLAGVSRSGELALSLRERFLTGNNGAATLARAPMGGGEPRPVLDFVDWADWAPDANSFAISRFLEGKNRLEFPIGRVLYASSNSIASPRVSPRGDLVAFEEGGAAQRVYLSVVERGGQVRHLAGPWSTMTGLAWNPSGTEIWFSVRGELGEFTILAADLNGKTRLLLRLPDGAIVHDISSSGRLLVERFHSQRGIFSFPPGEKRERELTWFDSSALEDMSDDGRTILFSENGAAVGGRGGFYLRKTDASPAVKLGEGHGYDISPDGRWILARAPEAPGLTLVPTGTGNPVPLDHGELESADWGRFFPDGKQIFLFGKAPGKSRSLYLQEIPGGKPRLLSEKGFGTSGKPISPDGKTMLAFRDWQEDLFILSFDGGAVRTIPNTKALDPVRWSADGRFFFAMETGSIPARIVKIDPVSGKRELWKELEPPGGSTIIAISNPRFTPDGRSYAFGYSSAASSDLFLVDGLK